jgi:GDP-4-dehydro-6-deoxy-D-mannose reductase
MRDVLDELIRLSGKRIEVVEKPELMRAAEQQRLCGSFAALTAATGWAPQISMTRTLADTLTAAAELIH